MQTQSLKPKVTLLKSKYLHIQINYEKSNQLGHFSINLGLVLHELSACWMRKLVLGSIFMPRIIFWWMLCSQLKGSLSPSMNENKLHKNFYCTLHKSVLIRFIQRNQSYRDAVMHEFHSNVNMVNKAVAKVRTIGDRLPLSTPIQKIPDPKNICIQKIPHGTRNLGVND